MRFFLEMQIFECKIFCKMADKTARLKSVIFCIK